MPDFASALDEAVPMADRAVKTGAEFLFLPEYCGGLVSDGAVYRPPVAPEETHPVLARLKEFCGDRHVWMMVGSIAIDRGDGKFFNRGYVIDDEGNIKSRYDKIHLFDVSLSDTDTYRESATVAPGRRAIVADTPYARVGHTICYDLRFPQLYRSVAQAGAEIICVPAAFTKRTGEAHWNVLNRARAIENGVFVVSCCAIGPIPGGGESYGHSMVVGPWGDVLADGGTLPGVVQATIDLDKVAEARTRIPSLTHDRNFEEVEVFERSVA